MQKKLTIIIGEDVYAGLHRVVGKRKISRFIETLVRPHVVRSGLDSDYEPVAADQERSIVEMLAMPEAADMDFEPPPLKGEMYRKAKLP